jgi:hypothetical protein
LSWTALTIYPVTLPTFFGGLVGSALLGQVFDHFGWVPTVVGVGLSLAIAARLTMRLT